MLRRHLVLLFLLPLLFIACNSKTDENNVAPVADAGMYQYLETCSTVYLNGSASHDANGDALTYRWRIISKPDGSTATLSSTTVVTPSFIADLEGDYRIELIVNDGQLDSEPAYVTISTAIFVDPSTGPQAANEIFTPSSATTEQRPMIVIRLQFKDQTFISDETTWQAKLFGSNESELNHYYHEISQNQFEFMPVNNDSVTSGITTVTFPDDNHPDPRPYDPYFGYDLNNKVHPLFKSAIEQVDQNGFDFNIYDSNSDGHITPDELIVTFIMAGEEDAYSGGLFGNGIWAHQWCTQSPNIPTVDGVSIMGCGNGGKYAVFGERHHDALSDSHDATVGIIAHELGHAALGLLDLYDTDINDDYGGIGYYGLMSHGTWGQKGQSVGEPGDTPTHMCAWSKIFVGWYSASSTSSDINAFLEINATGTEGYNIVKAPISGSTDEYFLVENRGTSGYDEGLKLISADYQGGLAIWHIDAKTISDNLENNSVNDDASHKGVDLEEANTPSLDGSMGDPTKNLYYSGNKTEFTPNTMPNTNLYNNARSYIFFTDISSQFDTMTMRINNPLL